MEIEEVLVAKIVSGGQYGSSERKTPAFDVKLLRHRLDDEVGRGEVRAERTSRGLQTASTRLLALFLRQAFLFHVARQPLDDPLGARVNKLLRNIEQQSHDARREA